MKNPLVNSTSKNEESLIAKFDDNKSNGGVQIVNNGAIKHNNNHKKM